MIDARCADEVHNDFPFRPASVVYRPANCSAALKVQQLCGEAAAVAEGLPQGLREQIKSALMMAQRALILRGGG